MKRFLLIASCAFLTAGLFSSCQKEDKSVLELAKDLTAELQKVTDLKSADSIAPRVQVINKRFQDAMVRPCAATATSLQRSGDDDSAGQEGAALQDALKALAQEVGRVQASLPVASADGDVDRDMLILAVGAANGAGDTAPASKRKATGTAHMKGESPKNESPGNFSEFYGSAKLREALDYTATPGTVGVFAMEEDPAPVPAAAPMAEDEPDETPAADDETPADDSADDSSDDTTADTTPAPADDDDADDSSDDDSSSSSSDDSDDGLPSLDLDSDSSSDDDSSDSTDSSDADSSDSDSEDSVDIDIEI